MAGSHQESTKEGSEHSHLRFSHPAGCRGFAPSRGQSLLFSSSVVREPFQGREAPLWIMSWEHHSIRPGNPLTRFCLSVSGIPAIILKKNQRRGKKLRFQQTLQLLRRRHCPQLLCRPLLVLCTESDLLSSPSSEIFRFHPSSAQVPAPAASLAGSVPLCMSSSSL